MISGSAIISECSYRAAVTSDRTCAHVMVPFIHRALRARKEKGTITWAQSDPCKLLLVAWRAPPRASCVVAAGPDNIVIKQMQIQSTSRALSVRKFRVDPLKFGNSKKGAPYRAQGRGTSGIRQVSNFFFEFAPRERAERIERAGQ